ncbi:hypothetical protein BaRGS_00001180 [Batillaria attramentaria]|uniref:Uncharacterized protein n=1 Tax=Batillaria attramentaria TaxID=370345 RepID=A0ABD0M5M5_9CAEN
MLVITHLKRWHDVSRVSPCPLGVVNGDKMISVVGGCTTEDEKCVRTVLTYAYCSRDLLRQHCGTVVPELANGSQAQYWRE